MSYILDMEKEIYMTELKTLLAEGCHLIRTVKKDGTPKIRMVTLDPYLILIPTSDKDRKENPDTMRVYDMDREGWVTIYPDTAEVLPR
jgi:hypothetical protein